MQALILAAGCGRRLEQDLPKPLIEINGRSLLIRLIEQLQACRIRRIVVVTGYQHQRVEEILHSYSILTVFNPFYSTSDNLVSFWVGQRLITQSFLLAHGDLVVEDELLDRVIKASGDVVLPMDRSSLNAESMKIHLVDGRLTDLNKHLRLEEADGESIPLMKFSRPAGLKLEFLAEKALEEGHLDGYIDDLIPELSRIPNLQTNVLNVTGTGWSEIDTKEDWAEAERIFGKAT